MEEFLISDWSSPFGKFIELSMLGTVLTVLLLLAIKSASSICLSSVATVTFTYSSSKLAEHVLHCIRPIAFLFLRRSEQENQCVLLYRNLTIIAGFCLCRSNSFIDR